MTLSLKIPNGSLRDGTTRDKARGVSQIVSTSLRVRFFYECSGKPSRDFKSERT